jgi:DNA polymerase III subunit epsilon
MSRRTLQHRPLPSSDGPDAETEVEVWRLAGILFRDLARGERVKLGRALGLDLAAEIPRAPDRRVREQEAIVDACRQKLASLDVGVLQQLSQIFHGSNLPEARWIEEVFRERVRTAFDGQALSSPASSDGSDALAPFSASGETLHPSRIRKGVEQVRVQAAFSPGGMLSNALSGYESRPGQIKMARAVAKALTERLHLIVEAGTGTGKSFAYLLPAVEYAVANGRRVVVSTNTINLQEQLFFKDIPLLRRALGIDFRAAVLKGRGNYLCLRRWRSFLREGVNTDAERIFAAKILLWLRETDTGDRSEIMLDETESVRWATQLAADAQHCTAKTCRDHRVGRCFLSRARRKAEGAHILVVNHALLLADQALESKVLPEYTDLVLDEAHHLEAAATKQLGVEIQQSELLFYLALLSQPQGPGRYAGLLSRVMAALVTAGGDVLRSQVGELTQPAHDAIDASRATLQDLFLALMVFVRGATDIASAPLVGDRDIRLIPSLRETASWQAVQEAWSAVSADFGQVDKTLGHLATVLESFAHSSELVDDALADVANARQQLTEYRVNISAIVTSAEPDVVCWLYVRERGIALCSAPLEVGSLLEDQLFSQKDCVILTSATLQVGGSFRYLRERIGLDSTTYTLSVPSPFDYPEQALLCVPDDLPEPSYRTFATASLDALTDICRATGGRTLVLFTSHGALRAAHQHLSAHLRHLVVLGQGIDGPRQQLLERFKLTPGAVLLGTSSFWEGIDVVGEALTCLVIVKLPFSVPTDPVFAARSELLEDPFGEYAVPQAALRLKQGFGRLIRSTTDRGVVAILDTRLWTKRYGQTFLRSLPPAALHRCRARDLGPLIKDWLARN